MINSTTTEIIKLKALKLYQSNNKAYLFYFHCKELKGLSECELDYEIARNLNINDNYIDYSININYPCKQNFCTSYLIIDKLIDKNNNIILIADNGQNIDIEIDNEDI